MTVRQYLGVAERGADGWWISFPAFPGVTSAGDTLAELAANARDALATAIELMQEDNQAAPAGIEADPAGGAFAGFTDLVCYWFENARALIVAAEGGSRSTRVNITMDEGLLARLDSMTKSTGVSRSALLARGARLVLAAGLEA